MPVTLKQIATQLELSHTTVSRVLNHARGGSRISETTRRRIVAAANEAGYRPNRLARALLTGKTHTVALWTFRIEGRYYSSVISRVQAHARARGLEVLIMETANDPGRCPGAWLDWRPVDAILAFDSPACVEAFVAAGGPSETPIVAFGSAPCRAGVDAVLLESRRGALDAIRHLVELGRRRIAYVGVDTSPEIAETSSQAYRDVMRSAGLPEERFLLDTGGGRSVMASARVGVHGYFTRHAHPDALFCFNDEVAIGAHRALRDLGLRIPEDVALVGRDGIEDAEYLDPPISTIATPTDEMCRQAWKLLDARLKNDRGRRKRIVLQRKLVVRGSSASDAGFREAVAG